MPQITEFADDEPREVSDIFNTATAEKLSWADAQPHVVAAFQRYEGVLDAIIGRLDEIDRRQDATTRSLAELVAALRGGSIPPRIQY